MTMVRMAGVATLLLLLVGTLSGAPVRPTSGAARDWPQWRGPERNGISVEKGLNTNWEAKAPQLVWMGDGLGGGYASVSVSGNRIYTTGNFPDGQSVVALNTADGQVVWKASLTSQAPQHGYEGSRCSPSIDGDRLYAISSDGKIACLRTADGSQVWTRDFVQDWKGRMMSGWGFSESPLVDGELVLCTPGGEGAMIVALNKMTGKEVWRAAVPQSGQRGRDGAGYSSIVVSQGGGVKQYVQLVGRGVIGVRASDGKFLWGYNLVANETANIPTPLVADNFVFSSSGYGAGAALLKLSGGRSGVTAEEVYFLNGKTFQNHHGGMVLVGDHVFAGHGHNEGRPICLNWKTGQVVWGGDQRGPGRGSAAVVYVDGHLIFRYQDGTVALIEASPQAYRLKGTLRPAHQERESWAHPAVADGKLYLREQDKLMCYDLRK